MPGQLSERRSPLTGALINVGLVLLAAAASIPAVAQQSEKRVALVIGNSAYAESPLKNPVNDARAMAVTLGGLGFDVIARENVTQKQMQREPRPMCASKRWTSMRCWIKCARIA